MAGGWRKSTPRRTKPIEQAGSHANVKAHKQASKRAVVAVVAMVVVVVVVVTSVNGSGVIGCRCGSTYITSLRQLTRLFVWAHPAISFDGCRGTLEPFAGVAHFASENHQEQCHVISP